MNYPVEKILSVAGALLCVLISVILWSSIALYQEMWPLPAAYFIEMAAVSVVGAIFIVHGHSRAAPLTWAAAGILTAFSILGAFSVGFFYLPVALLLGLAALVLDLRARGNLIGHIGLWLGAAIVQVLLMFAIIQLMYP